MRNTMSCAAAVSGIGETHMGEIREIKEEIQIFEIKDISDRFSHKDLEKSVLNAIKANHHHQDGSPVQLQVVGETEGMGAGLAKYVDSQQQRWAEQTQKPVGKGGMNDLDTIADQASSWESSRQKNMSVANVGVAKSAYDSGSGSNMHGMSVQCNCGMEFNSTTSSEREGMMITANQYQGNAADEGTVSYQGSNDDDWSGSAYQSGNVGGESGSSNYHRGV